MLTTECDASTAMLAHSTITVRPLWKLGGRKFWALFVAAATHRLVQNGNSAHAAMSKRRVTAQELYGKPVRGPLTPRGSGLAAEVTGDDGMDR